MERDTTFKDHHLWELQRRDALHNSLSLPVGVLTIVAGGALAMAKSIEAEPTFFNVGLIVTLAMTTLLLIGNLYCLAKSLIFYKYSHAPDMVVWLRDREHFEREYRENWQTLDITEAEAKESARRDFYYHLDETYAKSARNNSIQNNRKAEWIARGHRFLISSVGSLMLAGVFFSLSPTKPADDAASRSPKDAKTVIIPSKPEKTVSSPASLPTTNPKGIERPPVREPVVSNERFSDKKDVLGLDDL